jgi:uncharacterized membrane protein (UPF0182 family)
MTTRRWIVVALAAVALLLVAGRELAAIYADYLWYDSLGATALWHARFSAELILRGGSAVLAGGFAFANLYAVRQSVVSLVLPRRLGNLEIGEEVPGRYLMATAVALSVVLGVLLAMPEQDWTTFLLARWGVSFNETETNSAKDLGFFVYRLPFENALWTWAFFTVLVVTITVIALYALTPSLKWQRGTIYATAYVRRHFTVLVGVLLLMLAWSFRLDMYSLLLDGSGPDGAFGYVDSRVGTIGDLVLALITLGASLVVIWAGFVGQLRLAGISVLAVIALSLLIREVAPAVVQHSGTDAERVSRERPFQATRASFTRRAFMRDTVMRADSTIGYPSLGAALPFVPAWDPPALARAIDGGRAADVSGVRIGWRWSAPGILADVVEPAVPGAAARAPWTFARVIGSAADDRGAPVRVAGPTASAIDDTPLEAPIVYPGATQDLIIADSLTHSTGTSLEPLLSRLANAWALQNFSIAFGDLQQPHPTIVLHRDVRDRIALLAPFFVAGRQIQPLLVGDSLYWGVDLYSASSTYPLSRRARIAGDDRSYLQHAAVAIVTSWTGDVTIVPDSAPDPIARTWVRHLQPLFGSWGTLPPGIQSLLAPPIDGITAQALAFGKYGSHFDNDPQRHVPTLDGADTSLITDPLPIILPGSKTTAVSLPLVDDGDRLRGLLIGTGGGSRRTYWYPFVSASGLRWTTVLDRLRSADSAGSVAREGPLVNGRVRAVPVGKGIAFVQPRYRWRPQSIPALSRIALLIGDSARSIAASATLGRGNETSLPAGDYKAAVAAAYSEMRDAMRRGDWAAFGRAFEALGHAIARGGGTP